ncbi:MAG TPA: TetR/AcrR family transcriptional regulator [Acidimicrobiales bacterium]|nr:TetR/AcrR family transcriptional regulator [Acidimicrobiales bacterium]
MPRATTEGRSQALSRREQRRLQHQDLSRNQLLDAAEEVFGRKGFHETTLKEVAELAEFSVGSVYSFFQNKDDLFLNVFLRRGAELVPAMEAAVAESDSPLDQLRRVVDLEVGFFRQHRHFGRLYLRSSSSALPPQLQIDDALQANFQRAMEIQARIFRRGQQSGELRAGDPLVLARLLSGMVATYQLLDPAVTSDDAEPVERLPLATLHEMIAGAFRA